MGQQGCIRLGGVDINFPYEPYGTQKAIMSKIAVTLGRRENCIIESPTGTGKTLSLLCSTLSFQQQQKLKKIRALSQNRCSNDSTQDTKSVETNSHETKPLVASTLGSQDSVQIVDRIAKRLKTEMDAPASENFRTQVPKIYYCTRTHEQIRQIVRELKKTHFQKSVIMSILSSRERTCILESVRNESNRNDLCRQLVRNRALDNNNNNNNVKLCPFYLRSGWMKDEFIDINKTGVWDIEDSIVFGKDRKLCSYFGARSILKEADIIFCPYNFILSPYTRRSSKVDLKNAIIIFDEAHNIETECRESVSFSINTDEIDSLIDSINRDLRDSDNIPLSTTRFLENLFNELKTFILSCQLQKLPSSHGDNIANRIMSPSETLDSLRKLNLDSENLTELKDKLDTLLNTDIDQIEDLSEKPTNSLLLSTVTRLVDTLDLVMKSSSRQPPEWSMIISKNSKKPNGIDHTSSFLYKFELRCMSPSLCFEEIHSLAWSVIVASGSLTPVVGLPTELGCSFHSIFRTPHITSVERVFATALSRGPNDIELRCTHEDRFKKDYQAEIGRVICDICKVVPNGILCFFTSHERMRIYFEYWTKIGLIGLIEQQGKRLFVERKSQTPVEFKDLLNKYVQTAKEKGAILFAVCRGKFSEGLDFADSAARAVITIGIPLLPCREPDVALKREYNWSAHLNGSSPINGQQWYDSQAFRVYNQAIGRCIRHKTDWGAIIMLDMRLKNYKEYLPSWVNVRCDPDYSQAISALEKFIKIRLSEETSLVKLNQ